MRLALEFGVEEVKSDPTKGGGIFYSHPVYAVHSQDDCQVVFENTLLSSLLFS